jgi:2-polyprenyl-6-methoxyphenol hydroxylase-like FAD-dependent oxidoreductase
MWEPADDAFDGFQTRRPAFELAMRRAADSDRSITFACPAQVAGLVFREGADPAPVVEGVRLADGTTIEADVVIDGSGRRTPVPGWLSAAGADVPTESQDCETTYHTRHYRVRPESGLPIFAVVAVRGEIPGAALMFGFPGDHSTIAICIGTSPGDDELGPLRENWGFDAALTAFPSAAPWVDPANSTPINDVAVMAGNRNIRRHYVVGGRPVALGLIPIGDALCTTNPAYGWGASMALTFAFAAVDAIGAHDGDLASMALAYDAAVRPEADAVYRESAAGDRYRIRRWRGLDAPADDAEEMARQQLLELGVRAGSTRDPVLGRALLRRTNLIERPDQTFEDPVVLAHATTRLERVLAKASEPHARRADLLGAIASAARP